MTWKAQLNADPLPWLLDVESPDVRYVALRDLVGLEHGDPELRAARKRAYRLGPIATVLDAMHADGYWEAPGPGYNPKYTATVWSLILLAQLGASIECDRRIRTACAYVLEHTLTTGGQFSASGAPSGTADCLQGNLCWALLELGCDPARLDDAFDWMARTVTGEGLSALGSKDPQRYYAGKCGPTFACGSNNKLPCAWGGAKVMQAFARLPREHRTAVIERAIEVGAEFLLGVDPATARYPTGYAAKPSSNWWKFGFPVFYVADILQIVEALVGLGYARDPRLANALALIRAKQDDLGRWPLDYDYAGKTWGDYGPKKAPNKWVTLRALRVLKAAAE
jgi:hypothetical protein